MDKEPEVKAMSLETPGTYRIQVQGHLDESWSDCLNDMIITTAFTPKNQPITILVGHLVDQAALSGVLNTLYELRMPLLSAEIMNEI